MGSNDMNSPIPQKRPKHTYQLLDDSSETEDSIDGDGSDDENSEYPEIP